MSRRVASRRGLVTLVGAAGVMAAVLASELPDGSRQGGPPVDAPVSPTALPTGPPGTASTPAFCDAVRDFTHAHVAVLDDTAVRPDSADLERAAVRLLAVGVPRDMPPAAVDGLRIVVEDTLAPYRAHPQPEPAQSPERNAAAGAFNRYLERTCPGAY